MHDGKRSKKMLNTSMESEGENRRAYFVRLWRENAEEPWRASVKTVGDGREIHFVSPEKLFLFLHSQMGDLESGAGDQHES
jgi:hypothetical protein